MHRSALKSEVAVRVDRAREIFQIVEAEYGIRLGYFTLTSNIWEYRDEDALRRAVRRYIHGKNSPGRPTRDMDITGTIHNELLPVFPHLKLIEMMHLSDSVTGEPMYALENGWYWFTNVQDWSDQHREFTPAQRAGAYLRCAPEHFEGVATKEQFAAVVEQLRPAWLAQARATRLTYGLDPTTQRSSTSRTSSRSKR